MDDPQIKALQKLLSTGQLRELKKGADLPEEDKPTMKIVVNGYIKRYRVDSSEGPNVQLIYGPTDLFPLTPLFKQLLDLAIYEGPETYRYGAMTDVTYYALDMKRFLTGVKKDPVLYKELLYICGKRIQTSIERLENLSIQSSHRRVAHYLVYLARRSGKALPKGILIRLPVTQQDLAENIGLSRGTVSKAVSQLRAEGLVTGTGNIVVLNLRELERRAYE